MVSYGCFGYFQIRLVTYDYFHYFLIVQWGFVIYRDYQIPLGLYIINHLNFHLVLVFRRVDYLTHCSHFHSFPFNLSKGAIELSMANFCSNHDVLWWDFLGMRRNLMRINCKNWRGWRNRKNVVKRRMIISHGKCRW